MATYTVTDLTTDAEHGLRGVLGYWDDSEAERVAGSAVAGDRVILLMFGEQDLGEDDNIIYPAAGVSIVGPGMGNLTIVGRWYCRGTGGTAAVTHMQDVTWSPAGLASLQPLGLITGVQSVCGSRDVSLVFRRVAFVDPSPVGASGSNLFTVESRSGDPIVCVMDECTFDGADGDCLSAKGDGNRISTLITLGGIYRNAGSDTEDQPITGHDKWRVYIWGGSFARNDSGGMAIGHSSGTTDTYAANIVARGPVQGIHVLEHSIVDVQGASLIGSIWRLARGVHWHNSGDSADVVSLIDGAIAEDCAFTSFGAARAAIKTTAQDTSGAYLRIVVDGYRGLDLRGSTGAITITDSILNCSNFPALADSGHNITTAGNKVTQAGSEIPFTGPGDVIAAIDQSVVDARIAEIDAMFGTAPEPNADALVAAVMAGDGSLLINAADAPAIAELFKPADATDVRDGVNNLGKAGTLVLPAESDVDYGIQYGADGTEFTGSAALSAAAVVDALTQPDVILRANNSDGEKVATQTTAAIAAAQSTTAAAQATAAASRVTTALPNAAPAAAGGLLTYGTGTGQLNPSGGAVDLVDVPNNNAVDAIRDGLATSEQVSQITAKLPSSAYLAGSDSEDGAVTAEVGELEAKQDQLIALFQSGLPDVGPGQQRGARRVVKGDTYSATGRQSLVTKHKNADWPTDLSEWTWAFTASKHPDNENDGDALAGSVDVVTATGDSRGLRINHTKAQTLAAAVGRHLYAVRGTNSGDSSIVWTVELGVVDVEEAASE